MKSKTTITPLRRTLALAVGTAILLSACSGGKASAPTITAGSVQPAVQKGKTLAVSVVEASKQEWANEVALDADIVSLASPTIAAEVAGKVTSVSVLPGQPVKKGQLLVTINSTDLSLAAADAEAQAAQIAAQLADKTRNLKRNVELAAKEYIGRAVLESSQAEVAAVAEQLNASRARAALARGNLAKAQVVAPYDAVVAQRTVAPGSYVRAGDTLVSLWSSAASTLRLQVPQEYAGQVKVGQKLTVHWVGTKIQTQVERVRSDINPLSRAFEVQAAVPTELQSVTGASLSALLETGRDTSLAVPALAIQLNGEKKSVFVVGPDQRAVLKQVSIGRQKDGLVEILDGLVVGDKVITEGAAFAQNGQMVKVAEAPAGGKP
jgi:membrane fusion protein (multidrug efflux system)